MPNLDKSRVSIDQSAPRNPRHPRPDLVYARDIYQKISGCADRLNLLLSEPIPSVVVGIIVGPAITQVHPVKCYLSKFESVCRIGIGDVRYGIIAARIVIAVFEKIY